MKALNSRVPSIARPTVRQSALGSVSYRPSASIPVHVSRALSTTYDASEIARYWSARPIEVIFRLLEISKSAASFLLAIKQEELTAQAEGRAPNSAIGGVALRESLTSLGPAFVKIGQWLSSRPDVLSPEYLRELELLQDRITPFPTDEALALMQEELGISIQDIFDELTPEPVAAASLGQVYKGRLRGTNDIVAVKVQRPSVQRVVSKDVFILRLVAAFVKKWKKFNTDLPSLLDEWASSLFKELDYKSEAANARKFRDLFATNRLIYVPHMYPELSSSRVLVMEWIEGERLMSNGGVRGDADLLDLRLVEVGVKCSLEQVIDQGYYHADPHAGNLIKTPDGRLCYLDFGMMGSIDMPLRQGLVRATVHMVNREWDELANDFVALGLLPPGSDKRVVVPALTSVFESALSGGLQNLSFTTLSSSLGRTMYEYKFRIPPFYTLLVRSLSVLEGIALSADPNYKVITAAYPWIARRLLTDTSAEMRDTLQALLYKDGAFQFARLELLLEQAVKTPGRVGFTAYKDEEKQSGDALLLLLGKDGDLVRKILIDEVAKGIDGVLRIALDAVVGRAQGQARMFLDTLQYQLNEVSPLPRNRGIFKGALPPNPAMELLTMLANAPRLAEEEDMVQVQGLTRLAALIQSTVAANGAHGGGGGPRKPAASSSSASFFREAAPSSAEFSMSSSRAGGDFDLRGFSMGEIAEMRRAASEAAAALQWISDEIETLPPAARQEALRMPWAVINRVGSRVLARAIRGALLPGYGGRPAATSSSASEADIIDTLSTPVASVDLGGGTGGASGVAITAANSNIMNGSGKAPAGVLARAGGPAIVPEAPRPSLRSNGNGNGNGGGPGPASGGSGSPSGRRRAEAVDAEVVFD